MAPYFAAIAEWYGAIRIGVTGGELHEIIARRLGDPFFGIFLNPGHQLHLDEWVNSPISAGSTIELRSGMAFQVDVIPATGTEYFTTNIEDGIALADAPLRDQLASALSRGLVADPARRAFMAEQLGIASPSRRPAALEPAGPSAAVPPAPGPRDDARRMTGLGGRCCAAKRSRWSSSPDLGGTDPSAPSLRPRHPANSRRSAPHHAVEPFLWGAYVMAPWCNRAAPGPTALAGREVNLAANFPDGSAIHGLVSSARWVRALERSVSHVVGGGGGWPWAFEVSQTASRERTNAHAVSTGSTTVDDAPMPAGIGLHPWFRRPVEVRLPAEAVYSTTWTLRQTRQG